MLNSPMPTNIHGFGLRMATQILKTTKHELLDWTGAKELLTLPAYSQETQRDFMKETEMAVAKDQKDVDVEEDEDG